MFATKNDYKIIILSRNLPVGNLNHSLVFLILATSMQFVEKLRQSGRTGACHFDSWDWKMVNIVKIPHNTKEKYRENTTTKFIQRDAKYPRKKSYISKY